MLPNISEYLHKGRIYVRRAHLAAVRVIKDTYTRHRAKRVADLVQLQHNKLAGQAGAKPRSQEIMTRLSKPTATIVEGSPDVGGSFFLRILLYYLAPLVKATGGRVFLDHNHSNKTFESDHEFSIFS
jgi:hypothetical protein